jgi:predicted AAA+ superfamily ATPase
MPKVRKIRSNALASQEVRHEPLGQVIEGDSMRGKYAPPSRGRRKNRKGAEGEVDFLDEKTSMRILDMTKDQQIEIEMEEQIEMQKRQNQQRRGVIDSDEEDDEVGEVYINEEDE